MGLILFLLGLMLSILLRNYIAGLFYVLVYLVFLAGSYSIVWIFIALMLR